MTGLATPTIQVNGDTIGIKPNTFEYDEGFGERKVRVKSAGGSSRQTVVTRDVETQKSSFKFTLLTEDVSVDLVREWLAKEDTNVIQAADVNFTRVFNQAIITTPPKNLLGVDGEIEIEWESKPAA